MALRQGGDAVRLLIADGVGIGKTVEAGLVAAELLAQGEAKGLAVLCSPALAPQWRDELRTKFNIDATLVLPSTVNRLNKGLRMGESLFDRHPYVVVSTDLIKQRNYRDDFARTCPDLVIVDEAHTSVTAGGANSRSGATLRHHLLQRLADDQEPAHALPDRHPAPRRRRRLARTPRPPRTPNSNTSPPTCLDPSTTPCVPNSPATSCNANAATSPTSSKTPPSPTAPPPKRPTNSTPTTGRCWTGSSTTPARPSPTTPSPEPSVNASAGGPWSRCSAHSRPAQQPPPPPCETVPRPPRQPPTRKPTKSAATSSSTRTTTPPPTPTTSPPAQTTPPPAHPPPPPAASCWSSPDRPTALIGPEKDIKLARLTDMVKRLLKDGYQPIVFCRYIPTAEYVGEHLRKALEERPRRSRHWHHAARSARSRRLRPRHPRRQPRARRHRLPLRRREPAGLLHRRRALRPRLEPHPARTARRPHRPVRAARQDRPRHHLLRRRQPRRRCRPQRSAPQARDHPQIHRRVRLPSRRLSTGHAGRVRGPHPAPRRHPTRSTVRLARLRQRRGTLRHLAIHRRTREAVPVPVRPARTVPGCRRRRTQGGSRCPRRSRRRRELRPQRPHPARRNARRYR